MLAIKVRVIVEVDTGSGYVEVTEEEIEANNDDQNTVIAMIRAGVEKQRNLLLKELLEYLE